MVRPSSDESLTIFEPQHRSFRWGLCIFQSSLEVRDNMYVRGFVDYRALG